MAAHTQNGGARSPATRSPAQAFDQGALRGAAPLATRQAGGALATVMQLASGDRTERNEDAALERGMAAAIRLGPDFFYSWRVKDRSSTDSDGKKAIEGISIDGAMLLMRAWGRCTVAVDVLTETPTHWTFLAIFFDFADQIPVSRLFRQRKNQDLGKMDADRAEDIVFQIGQSKAQRNAIIRGLPAWFTQQSLQAVKDAGVAEASAYFENLIKEAHRVNKPYPDGTTALSLANTQALKAFDVEPAQLEARFGPVVTWTWQTHVELQAIQRGLTARETTLAAEFGPDDAPEASQEQSDAAVAPAARRGGYGPAPAAPAASPPVGGAGPAKGPPAASPPPPAARPAGGSTRTAPGGFGGPPPLSAEEQDAARLRAIDEGRA